MAVQMRLSPGRRRCVGSPSWYVGGKNMRCNSALCTHCQLVRTLERIKRRYAPLSICPGSVPQETTMQDEVEAPFGRCVTVSDLKLFAVDRAWLNGNDTNYIHVIREVEYGCLDNFPFNGVLPLRGVRPDRKLDVHALCTPRAGAKGLRSRSMILFENLGCGTKAIA